MTISDAVDLNIDLPRSPSTGTQPPAQTVDSALVRAAHGLQTPHTPVWFMRQAGRSLPEYRALRKGTAMLAACRTPDLVTEITLQPVRRHGVDAAIFFSDIVVPVQAVGVDLDIVPGVGPVVAEPIASIGDLGRLPELTPDMVTDIDTSVRRLVAELGPTPLIGFAGAPFTLASYLIEGGPSKNHVRTKALMHGDPQLWHALCSRLAQISAQFLAVQIGAGASAIQLFDSWAGFLSRRDYLEFVEPHSRSVLASLESAGVPRIHFGVGTSELLVDMAQAGAEVIGVDYRMDMPGAIARTQGRYAVQGNLDPALLFAPWEALKREVRRILIEGQGAPGHIFNLGHGVLPETDPDVITRVVELVQTVSQK